MLWTGRKKRGPEHNGPFRMKTWPIMTSTSRDRRRPRRLCRGDPRGAARPQDGLRRKPRDAGRHLPQRRLHPVQGAAPRFRTISMKRIRARWREVRHQDRSPSLDLGAMHGGADKVVSEGADRRDRVSVQEEQGRMAQGPARQFTSAKDSVEVGAKAYASARRTSSSPPVRRHAAAGRRGRSTRRSSSIRPARSNCPRCRSISS
jgi:hypothetical protein